jgi:hypothetical protein
MYKLIIFSDSYASYPAVLIKATMNALENRDDIKLESICMRRPRKYSNLMYWHFRNLLRRYIRSIFDTERKAVYGYPWPLNLERLAKRHGFKNLTPPGNNLNDPKFIDELRKIEQPSIAFSIFCGQRFRPQLLGVFEHAVNYHNGLLPKYRGVGATLWSIYNGEKESGFTFHRMNEEFDEGPILLQGSIPLRTDRTVFDIEYEKVISAAKSIPLLFDKLIKNEEGTTQTGEANYFSSKDLRGMRNISDPSTIESSEFLKRLQSFVMLNMKIKGNWYRVTKLEQVEENIDSSKALCFRSRDGVTMKPTRFDFLPLSLYKFQNIIKKYLLRDI